MSSILPFGTSTNSPTEDLQQIKLFGCTVVDFNVSADWSSQGGSLSCRIIEDETDGDRLVIPVLGSPVLFELRDSFGNVKFQYIGIVDSFSRSSTNSKTYSVNLTSPLRILESTQVILDGYTGLGFSLEGNYNLTGLQGMDFGHNNSLINDLDLSPGVYKWRNVSNLINVFGILENDNIRYRVPTNVDAGGRPTGFGGFGMSANSKDGMPVIKLMWALHLGINHLLPISNDFRQRTHGGNLLFGRQDYNVNADSEPYWYHVDILDFYNQVIGRLSSQTGEGGAQYRISGQNMSLKDIITKICDDANLEYFSYIDIYSDPSIGNPTLFEYDANWTQSAICNWGLDVRKFTNGGRYGGTIRIKTIDKNSFFNSSRPFSNIAYNLIGLEVPDIHEELWAGNHNNGIHPGRRPVNDATYGLSSNSFIYSDPLDSAGINNTFDGFTKVGTSSIANGGRFPVESGSFIPESGIFDPAQLNNLKIKNSDISIKLNDMVTMKVVTGGYQSRIVDVPGNMLRHYWGDIILPVGIDPRQDSNSPTDPLGLNETSTRKIPVITPLLDPRDVDDFILVDMTTHFGQLSIAGVFRDGIYAASLFEIRCAMRSFESWKAFMEKYKYEKLRRILKAFFSGCISTPNYSNGNKYTLEKSTESINEEGGLGYAGCSDHLGLGNTIALNEDTKTSSFNTGNDVNGDPRYTPGAFGLGLNLPCAVAQINTKKYLLPLIFEKLKEIGDTHYGKSWYAPTPYAQTIQDLDGENLVGNFKRSWELTDSAYVEPASFYSRFIPQSSQFISDGKVSSFVNYDHNFIANGGNYDKSYADEITNITGQSTQIFNFSEYELDSLCITKYNFTDPVTLLPREANIIHAMPNNVESNYVYLPFAYDRVYNRAYLPFSKFISGKKLRYKNTKSEELAPKVEGNDKDLENPDPELSETTEEDNKANRSQSGDVKCPNEESEQIPTELGFFDYDIINGIPAITNPVWLNNTVDQLKSLSYEDNGRFSFPFVKFTTSRVFLPIPKPGFSNGFGNVPSMYGFNIFTSSARDNGVDPDVCGDGGLRNPNGPIRQSAITEDTLISILNPFQACVSPKSFHFPQISTRYVYGPWMTSLGGIVFRGRIEYEQDDSLVPENFLIPTNFGNFGSFSLSQSSGMTGMNFAAQARANAIDNFSLFAVEEGSITIPGSPRIKRIGDTILGLQQISDVKVNITESNIETTYSFKTISPKFGKNTRDLEKKLTKISNDIKKLKLR